MRDINFSRPTITRAGQIILLLMRPTEGRYSGSLGFYQIIPVLPDFSLVVCENRSYLPHTTLQSTNQFFSSSELFFINFLTMRFGT